MSGTPRIVNKKWFIESAALSDIQILYPANYENFEAESWLELLLFAWQRRVRVQQVELAQPYKGIVLFQFVKNEKKFDIVVDYSDYPDINADAARRAVIYFKMQYDAGGYEFENVIPGGYVSDSWRLYWNLRRFQRLRDKQQFAYDVYGRFGLAYAREVRGKAVEMLNAQNEFCFEGGLKKVKFKTFLREVAQSKIAIDLPGNGSFCFRLINYLAVGACVVAFPHTSLMHVPLVNKKNIVYVEPDFSNLIEVCDFYLRNDQERELICRESRQYFEENLHNENLANYYLKRCFDAV